MERDALALLVRRLLPRCPGLYREEIVRRLAGRPLAPRRESDAVLEMARAVIRHQLTDYDSLWSRHGLDPEEARLAVAGEIDDQLADWR